MQRHWDPDIYRNFDSALSNTEKRGNSVHSDMFYENTELTKVEIVR